MKLKRAAELNRNAPELRGTSQGVYYIVGTPFLVLKFQGHWFVCGDKKNKHTEWMARHNLIMSYFPTRRQALDALEMALMEEPL